jgi:hypothetical protein
MTALAAVPDRPDTSQLAAQSAALIADAESIVIVDQASFEAAVEFGKGAQSLRKKIVDFFSPHKKRAKAVHDELCADEKRQLDGPDRAVVIIKGKILDWQRTERERLAVEQRDREKKAQKLEEDRRLQEAIDLESEGDRVGADEALTMPIAPPIVGLKSAGPKVSGIAIPKKWTFDESKVDFARVVMHIAGVEKLAHPEFLRVLCLDTKATRQLVTAMKDTFNCPGITAYEAESVSLGSK